MREITRPDRTVLAVAASISGSSYTGSLAAVIAESHGADTDDVEPWVAANAMMGVHRALVDYTRRRIVAGARDPRLAGDGLAQADRALALLEHGLGDRGP